jgi:hypothetical protein
MVVKFRRYDELGILVKMMKTRNVYKISGEKIFWKMSTWRTEGI